MRRSPEIEQVVRQFVDAVAGGDLGTVERLCSNEQGVVAIGSDAREYSRNFAEIMELMRDSTPEGESGITARIDDIAGYEEGNVGWADGTGRFERDGDSVQVRMTAVARRENGEWRFVQSHASIGVPNEKMFEPLFRSHATSA